MQPQSTRVEGVNIVMKSNENDLWRLGALRLLVGRDLIAQLTPVAMLVVLLNLWLKRVPSSAWCVRAAVVVQVCLADTVVGLRRLVSKNSQLTTEPERADLGSVLKAHTPGTKCLVPDCQGKFADLV